jgi:hypothetical protein
MSARPAPDVDAALVLGMASTALPFARSPEAEAERWLRILRMHGQAGAALQSLGVSEAPIEDSGVEEGPRAEGDRRDIVATVTEGAVGFAAHRGASTVGADDVLVAVMQVYGEDFDNVLRAHGTDRYEVLARLGVEPGDAGV